MWQVYSQMPDFASIGTFINSNKERTDEDMKKDFWEDKWFGGPLYDPVYKYEYVRNEDGSIVE